MAFGKAAPTDLNHTLRSRPRETFNNEGGFQERLCRACSMTATDLVHLKDSFASRSEVVHWKMSSTLSHCRVEDIPQMISLT